MGGASRWWLNGSLEALAGDLARLGGTLILRKGAAPEVLAALLQETGAAAIYATKGYQPWEASLERDIGAICQSRNAELRLFPGRLLFEPDAIKPYRVFTPFWKACLAAPAPRAPLPQPKIARFAAAAGETLASFKLLPTTPDWAGGLRATWTPGEHAAHARLHRFIDAGLAGYADDRGALDGDTTSRLSPHLHFGELSPNQVWHAVNHAATGARGKLTWRRSLPARARLARILVSSAAPLPGHHATRRSGRNSHASPGVTTPRALDAWRRGETGYPIVDAAMRELWRTGFMPNRARMIVASFLVKHCSFPGRQGADWFLDTLVDADLANNSASWQWVAGSGTDAAPYFRIFNPVLQGLKFDSRGDYVRTWVPELAKLQTPDIHAPWEAPPLELAEAGVTLGVDYPKPIVDHATARARALAAFKRFDTRMCQAKPRHASFAWFPCRGGSVSLM